MTEEGGIYHLRENLLQNALDAAGEGKVYPDVQKVRLFARFSRNISNCGYLLQLRTMAEQPNPATFREGIDSVDGVVIFSVMTR